VQPPSRQAIDVDRFAADMEAGITAGEIVEPSAAVDYPLAFVVINAQDMLEAPLVVQPILAVVAALPTLHHLLVAVV